MSREQIHFVTGKLAEPALRSALARLAPQVGFEYTLDVLPISVAALMTAKWVARRLHAPAATARVVLPGYCDGDLDELAAAAGCPVERGPREIADLDDFFGMARQPPDLSGYDIEIIAEINHAPRLPLSEILRIAKRYADDGADIIDVGCDIGQPWSDVGRCVRALREEGHRVSIDSLDPREIEPAIVAGAELVLSVNSMNREAARDWPCEVVAIPDAPDDLESLAATLDVLDAAGVKRRIDPILEPIGVGLAASFERYSECRRR